MTKYEIIRTHSDFFTILSKNGIEPKEVKHLPMVERYRELKTEKVKIGYIITCLSNEYHLTERAVYKIIKRFSQDIRL